MDNTVHVFLTEEWGFGNDDSLDWNCAVIIDRTKIVALLHHKQAISSGSKQKNSSAEI